MPSAADTGGSVIPGYGYFRIAVGVLGLLNRNEQRRVIDDAGPAAGTSMQGGGPGSITRVAAGPPNRMPVPVQPPPPVFQPPIIYRPPPEPPTYGSGSSGIPPRPPPGAPSTPPINPNAPPGPQPVIVSGAWPYVVGGILGPDIWNWTKQGAMWSYDWWRAGQNPKTPRRRPGGPGQKIPKIPKQPTERPPEGNPFPPQGPPVTVIVQMPAEAKPPKKQPNPMAGLGGIYVNRSRLPVPTVVATPVAPPKTPLWMQLLPLLGPSVLGFLQPRQGNRTVLNLTDPLTPGAGGNPFPDTGGLTAFQPMVGDYGAFGGDGAVGTNTCECKPKRKKGRKKRRTVCYSGTFIERADGTSKYKKRRVDCK